MKEMMKKAKLKALAEERARREAALKEQAKEAPVTAEADNWHIEVSWSHLKDKGMGHGRGDDGRRSNKGLGQGEVRQRSHLRGGGQRQAQAEVRKSRVKGTTGGIKGHGQPEVKRRGGFAA